jgi:SAM-dependent methyltransferase
MGMAVLQDEHQIQRARQELVRRKLSTLDSPLRALLRRLRLDRSRPVIGDHVKSWDVLRTIEFIEQHVPKDGAVLDLGAYASEIIVALHRLGYGHLAGVDLDPDVRRMPHGDAIKYEVADFLQTRFADASFDAITSISVIEHGFQCDRLLKEMSRLLRPGGYFIASFDYWPNKIDTTGTTFFGMSWTIFSQAEISGLIENAKRYGLRPPSDIAMDATDRPIACGGKEYTFGWIALQKAR